MDIYDIIKQHNGARHIAAKLPKCLSYMDVVKCRAEFSGYLSSLLDHNEISYDERERLINEFDKLSNHICNKKRGATI